MNSLDYENKNWLSFHNVCEHSVMSDSLWLCGLEPARLHCWWNFPGKNTGAGCHFLLWGIFLTQGSNVCLLSLLCPHLLCLLRWQADSLPLWTPGKSPLPSWKWLKSYVLVRKCVTWILVIPYNLTIHCHT